MHTSEASSPAKNRQETSKASRHGPLDQCSSTHYFNLPSIKNECALCLLVTRFQLKEMEWTTSGRRMRFVV